MTARRTAEDVTIVVVTRLLRKKEKRLEAFRKVLRSLPWECPLIFVDNAGEIDPMELVKNPQGRGPDNVIYNPKNYNVHYARNQGAAVAQTPFVLFLDDDTKLRAGAVDRALQVSLAYRGAAVVGLLPPRRSRHNPMTLKGNHWLCERKNPRVYDAATLHNRVWFQGAGQFRWCHLGWKQLRLAYGVLGVQFCVLNEPGAVHLCPDDALYVGRGNHQTYEPVPHSAFPETAGLGTFSSGG